MKQKNFTWASGFIILCLLVSVSFLFSSYRAKKITDDVWQMLGLSRNGATEAVKNSFLNGYLYYYGAKNFKNIAINDRAAITADLLDYTKKYISSEEFKKQYRDLRKNAQPREPILQPIRSISEIQQDEISKTEKSIRDAEKTLKEVNADMAKAMQPVVDMLRKNLKDFQNPNHEYFLAIATGEKYQQEGQLKTYNDNLKKWNNDFPENINEFVADKLKKMLEYTNGIDYNAALVEKYGKKRFVNPAYEGKRTEWKQGFRAGKQVTEQARAFVEKWLTELK